MPTTRTTTTTAAASDDPVADLAEVTDRGVEHLNRLREQRDQAAARAAGEVAQLNQQLAEAERAFAAAAAEQQQRAHAAAAAAAVAARKRYDEAVQVADERLVELRDLTERCAAAFLAAAEADEARVAAGSALAAGPNRPNVESPRLRTFTNNDPLGAAARLAEVSHPRHPALARVRPPMAPLSF